MIKAETKPSMQDIRVLIGLAMALCPDMTCDIAARLLGMPATDVTLLMHGSSVMLMSDPDPIWMDRLPSLIALLGDPARVKSEIRSFERLLDEVADDMAVLAAMRELRKSGDTRYDEMLKEADTAGQHPLTVTAGPLKYEALPE